MLVAVGITIAVYVYKKKQPAVDVNEQRDPKIYEQIEERYAIETILLSALWSCDVDFEWEASKLIFKMLCLLLTAIFMFFNMFFLS